MMRWRRPTPSFHGSRAQLGVLFCHSSCDQPSIVGMARVAPTPYPDPTQFDPKSPYYDPASKRETQHWRLTVKRLGGDL